MPEIYKRARVTQVLLAINVVVFLAETLCGGSEDVEVALKFGVAYTPLITEDHQYYRLLTSCFLHFGMEHLMTNMLSLFAMGPYVERVLGRVRFLALYLISGVCGNLLYVATELFTKEYHLSAGASGAICGMLGVFVLLAVLTARPAVRPAAAHHTAAKPTIRPGAGQETGHKAPGPEGRNAVKEEGCPEEGPAIVRRPAAWQETGHKASGPEGRNAVKEEGCPEEGPAAVSRPAAGPAAGLTAQTAGKRADRPVRPAGQPMGQTVAGTAARTAVGGPGQGQDDEDRKGTYGSSGQGDAGSNCGGAFRAGGKDTLRKTRIRGRGMGRRVPLVNVGLAVLLMLESGFSNSSINVWAHIGGLAAGFVLAGIFYVIGHKAGIT